MTSSETVAIPRHARIRAKLNTSWWMFRPLAILVLILLLFVATYIGYTVYTTDGTYWRELAIALIGTLLTISGTFVLALITFREQMHERREAEKLRRLEEDSWRRSHLQVGAMRIPDIVVVTSSRKNMEWTTHTDMLWEAFQEERPVDSIGEAAYTHRLGPIKERARQNSISLSDDACVDLRRARFEVVSTPNGRRRRMRLTPATSTYFRFLTTTASLDEPQPYLDNRTLREAWNVNVLSLEGVSDLPCLAKIGVGTAAVTKDNRLVLGVRGRTMIAGGNTDGRKRVHIVAEGMIPGDLGTAGVIDPAVTSTRALYEELAVGRGSDELCQLNGHYATGMFFDQLRMQPCFSYLATLNMEWDELASLAPAAPDFWEVAELESIGFDIANVGLRRLLLGQHPDMEFASNHAAAVVWFACVHRFGLRRMRDALSVPLPAISSERGERH